MKCQILDFQSLTKLVKKEELLLKKLLRILNPDLEGLLNTMKKLRLMKNVGKQKNIMLLHNFNYDLTIE